MFLAPFLIAPLVFLVQAPSSPKQAQTQKSEEIQTQTFVEYRDLSKGVTFKMDNGRVELTVPSESAKAGEARTSTYKANSLEEFKHQYPEIAKKYDIDRYLPDALSLKSGEKGWSDWATRFEKDREDLYHRYFGDLPKDTPHPWANLDRWFDRERQMLRDFERNLRMEGVPTMAEPKKDHAALFGVLVCPVEEAMRLQLGIKPDEGLLVAEVQKGSTAEMSGVRKYDVIVRLNSQSVKDTESFRGEVASALRGKEFILEVIRGGSPLKLTIHPAHS